MDTAPHKPVSPETIARGHEGTAVSLRGYVICIIALTVGVVSVQIGVWYMMRGFAHFGRTPAEDLRENSPLAAQRPSPPQPWLQPSLSQPVPHMPWQDMQAFRADEDHTLSSYGPSIDGKAGVVSIPIQRAMQIIADQGLPTAPRATGGKP